MSMPVTWLSSTTFLRNPDSPPASATEMTRQPTAQASHALL